MGTTPPALQLQRHLSLREEQSRGLHVPRHPLPHTSWRQMRSAETYINLIASHATPKAMTLEAIKAATASDARLQQVMQHLETGEWYNIGNELQQFHRIRHELSKTTNDTLVLRGTQIVLPDALQNQAIRLAHEGHQGLARTKQLLRGKVWFPGIDSQAAHLINKCLPCQANTPKQTAEPLRMSNLPSGPWREVTIHFCGPYPTGEYLMVIIDNFSKFPIVELIRSTAASSIIPHLDKIFGIFGIPETVRIDNGPPFNGHEFAEFAINLAFKHHRTTPLWPQANGEAERFMRTLGKTIKASVVHRGKWKQELATMLRNYRATPHVSTGATPTELLFGRKLPIKRRNSSPSRTLTTTPSAHETLRVNNRSKGERTAAHTLHLQTWPPAIAY